MFIERNILSGFASFIPLLIFPEKGFTEFCITKLRWRNIFERLTSVVHSAVPFTVRLSDHVPQLGALHVLSEPAHGPAQLLRRDVACLGLVKYTELEI